MTHAQAHSDFQLEVMQTFTCSKHGEADGFKDYGKRFVWLLFPSTWALSMWTPYNVHIVCTGYCPRTQHFNLIFLNKGFAIVADISFGTEAA